MSGQRVIHSYRCSHDVEYEEHLVHGDHESWLSDAQSQLLSSDMVLQY